MYHTKTNFDMKQEVIDLILNRRTRYDLSSQSTLSEEAIREIISTTLLHVPSSFNSQSTRVVLLLGGQHKRLWEITKDTLRKIVPANAFAGTEAKIDGAFASGHGTILFFEDQETISKLQQAFPLYKDNFPVWSQHTAGMHQYVVWSLLAEAGMGASLQHYNPLIDEAIAREWNISPQWKLTAQMPFGVPTGQPGQKEFLPLEQRLLVFPD